MKHDIIYILKNNYSEEELKYSLRSVCMNFPYRKVVFVGGCPKDITPDIYIEHNQTGMTKWARSNSSLMKALASEELTEDVWLFNDDFFVMNKVKANEDINYFNGTLEKRIIDLKKKNPRGSNYISQLERLRGRLLNLNKDTLSFALHLPMLINREKALNLFNNKKIDATMFRSAYGNYYEIPCHFMKDVKIYDLESIPDGPFVSTSDSSFAEGEVGIFLKKYFSKPCKYEKSEKLREETKERYTEEGEEKYE